MTKHSPLYGIAFSCSYNFTFPVFPLFIASFEVSVFFFETQPITCSSLIYLPPLYNLKFPRSKQLSLTINKFFAEALHFSILITPAFN